MLARTPSGIYRAVPVPGPGGMRCNLRGEPESADHGYDNRVERRDGYISTIGAQVTETNLLTQHTIIERAIAGLPMPIMFLRPAWFMENSSWDVAPAIGQGVIPSF